MYPKTFFASEDVKQRSGKCFVIMPFAPQFDEIYETIRETLEGPELNLNCSRADELQGGGHIIRDILREIAEAEIVIADLTTMNPNVFYELGIVQMVKDVENVILLCQDSESIPFDLRVFRCIIYRQSIKGARELKNKLIDNIKPIIKKYYRFKLIQRGSYKLPEKLMGADHCAYDFEISECFFAGNAAKFMLRVTRYVVGQAPTVSFDGGFGLMVGEQRQLPGLGRNFLLESVDDDVASFVVQRDI